MNKLIFFVLGAAVGAAVGAGTTYFVMKRKRLERAVVGEEIEETSEDEFLDMYDDWGDEEV